MLVATDKHGLQVEINEETLLELKFLRFIYDNVQDYLGPSDWDIYQSLKESFLETYYELPRKYYDPISFRIWPDGTIQEVDQDPPYNFMSDDFILIEAFSETDAYRKWKKLNA